MPHTDVEGIYSQLFNLDSAIEHYDFKDEILGFMDEVLGSSRAVSFYLDAYNVHDIIPTLIQ